MRSKNVAEANRGENRFTICSIILDNHLIHTLSRTHHIGWVDCFIRENLNEVRTSVLISKPHDVQRSKNIVLNSLARISLHERDMLVCRRMKYHLGSISLENRVDSR